MPVTSWCDWEIMIFNLIITTWRQTQDDTVLNVINRYWNQLNEDIRTLVQRFDAETSDESESKNESEATTSFLAQLSTYDKNELDDKLANRVQVSTRAVAKII